MTTQEVISLACEHIERLVGHEFDVLEVMKPVSPSAAVNLAKIISKLSPLVGNLIEFNICEYLNDQEGFSEFGKWERQDPGFPDTIFVGSVSPTPGFEVKAWFPLATEITARFKDSQTHFLEENTYVAMLAWLPEFLIFGKPKIIGIAIIPASSVAKARDDHYHQPPDYLVLEPQDTTERTANLQQTNTNGYKFQGSREQFAEAKALLGQWGISKAYSTEPEYQKRMHDLIGLFDYRLDTNFAKMDRIEHAGIEDFKKQIYNTLFHGKKIGEWNKILSTGEEEVIQDQLANHFGIVDNGRPIVD